MIRNWTAYCTTCKQTLYEVPNGNMVEAAGKIHAKETGHDVIVGLRVAVETEAVQAPGYTITATLHPRGITVMACDRGNTIGTGGEQYGAGRILHVAGGFVLYIPYAQCAEEAEVQARAVHRHLYGKLRVSPNDIENMKD